MWRTTAAGKAEDNGRLRSRTRSMAVPRHARHRSALLLHFVSRAGSAASASLVCVIFVWPTSLVSGTAVPLVEDAIPGKVVRGAAEGACEAVADDLAGRGPCREARGIRRGPCREARGIRRGHRLRHTRPISESWGIRRD